MRSNVRRRQRAGRRRSWWAGASAAMDIPESGAPVIRASPPTVCVTGSTGYIGSWLVRSLLRRGYGVHAVARDLGKASDLLTWWIGSEEVGHQHLKLFKADLGEEGGFDEAVQGCVGVFHVAASMEWNVPSGTTDLGKDRLRHRLQVGITDKLVPHMDSLMLLARRCRTYTRIATARRIPAENHVRSNMLEPAIRGTINVLSSCQKARSTVRRVVFTSSISTITAKDVSGKFKPVVDESSTISVDATWKNKLSGWVYALSKLLAEEAAFRYARENGIDLVSVVTPTVAGPFFTPKVPASVRLLLSPITNDQELYSILLTVHSRLGSIYLVHIEDICSAHIFLLEKEVANGRYICSAGSCVMHQLVDMLSSEYPLFTDTRRSKELFRGSLPPVVSSNRLLDLGFVFKYGIGDVVRQSVHGCLECGFLRDAKANDGW